MINKVILVWDGEGGGIQRYHIDNKYKANRKNKEMLEPMANAAILSAPPSGLPLNDEIINAEYSKPQGINAHSMPI